MVNKIFFNNLLAAIFITLALTACSETENTDKVDSNKTENTALMLKFEETEPGVDPYVTRILINDRFMRMDDGVDASNFALLDRANNTIYNVTHESRNILVINKKPVTIKSPVKLSLDAKKIIDADAPQIAGREALRYELMVNDKKCATLVTVPGLLPQAVKAMREFQRVLAGTHAENLSKTPVEMMDTCFLAHDIFAPVRTLQYGFPIHQQDVTGNARSLVDYNESFKDIPELYKLPDAYQRTQMGSRGNGGA